VTGVFFNEISNDTCYLDRLVGQRDQAFNLTGKSVWIDGGHGQ
jgi:hypothetical protein